MTRNNYYFTGTVFLIWGGGLVSNNRLDYVKMYSCLSIIIKSYKF